MRATLPLRCERTTSDFRGTIRGGVSFDKALDGWVGARTGDNRGSENDEDGGYQGTAGEWDRDDAVMSDSASCGYPYDVDDREEMDPASCPPATAVAVQDTHSVAFVICTQSD